MAILQRQRQQGIYTLIVSILLISASILAVRGLAKSSILETRIATNDLQTREVSLAAEVALDYAISWYAKNEPSWAASGGLLVGSMTPPTMPASNGDVYTGSITFRKDTSNALSEGYVLIVASAQAATDSAITATIRQYVHDNLLLSMSDLSGPPLLVNGCLSNVTGNPDIYVSAEQGVGVVTNEPAAGACIESGHLDYTDSNGDSIPDADAVAYDGFYGDIWNVMFDISRADMKAIAVAEVAAGVADSDRTVVWVTSTANYHDSWGSPSNPVILVFDAVADCPRVNGSPTYYGVIFVDSECTGAHGWGGTEVFGTVAVNGDIGKFNSNTEITNWGEVDGGDPYNLKSPWVARIPGSWSDF